MGFWGKGKGKLNEPEARRHGFSQIQPYFDARWNFSLLQLKLYNSPVQIKRRNQQKVDKTDQKELIWKQLFN
jgi:hypothetical protein